MNMRILVTGRSGQLARALAEVSLPPGWRMSALGRREMDITVPDEVRKGLDRVMPDIVVNTAAWTDVEKSEAEEERALALNRDGPAYLAEACRQLEIPLIHISTDYVFDGRKGVPYTENDTPRPLNAYGRSKLAGERAVMEIWERSIILRTAWLFGPHGRNFLPRILKLAREREMLSVVDDQRGSPTCAPYLAEGIIAMIRKMAKENGAPGKFQGIFHAAGDGEATWHDLAAEVLRVARQADMPLVARLVPVRTEERPVVARRPADSRLDCTRLREVFGLRLPLWRRGVAVSVRRFSRGER